MTEYRDVPGFPGYRAGDDGSLWSDWLAGCRPRRTGVWHRISARVGRGGRYPQVNLRLNGRGCSFKLHVVILLAFRGPKPAGRCTRHLNDDPSDNRLENLVYGTYAENQADRIANGRDNKGERHGNSKLTALAVLFIRRRAAEGASLPEIVGAVATEFGVRIHKSTACQIAKGHAWRHVEGAIP